MAWPGGRYALMAAAAGKPAYVEKPMGTSQDGTQAVVDRFRAAKLPLFVAYYRRALPNFLAVRLTSSTAPTGLLSWYWLLLHNASHRLRLQDQCFSLKDVHITTG